MPAPTQNLDNLSLPGRALVSRSPSMRRSDLSALKAQREQIGSMLQPRSVRIIFIRDLFGAGKTDSVIDFIYAVEDNGRFSLRLLILFILTMWYLCTVSVHTFTIGAINIATVRCKIPALEGRFNFTQILNISLKNKKNSLQDAMSTQYCEYDVRDYNNKLYEEFNHDYQAIMDYISKEKTDPKTKSCNDFVVRQNDLPKSSGRTFMSSRTLRNEFNFFCHNNIWLESFWLLWIYGTILSNLVGGISADIFGRKQVFVASSLIYLVGSLFLALPSKWCLLLGKFLMGCGAISYPTLYVLFVEQCSRTTLLWMGFLVCLYTPLATWTSFLLRYGISNWRMVHLANTSMLLLLPFTIWYLNESPRWLMLVGNKVAAWKALRDAGSEAEPSSEDLQLLVYTKPTAKTILQQLFQPIMRQRIAACAFLYFFESIALYLETRELRRDVQFHTQEFYLISATLELAILTCTCLAAIKFGRKLVVFTMYCVLTVDGAILFMVNRIHTNNVVLMAFMDSHLAISQTVVRLLRFYTIEMFPTPCRLTALSICRVAYGFAAAMQQHLRHFFRPKANDVTYMPAFIAAITCVLLVCFLPETRNNGLPDTLREAIYTTYNTR